MNALCIFLPSNQDGLPLMFSTMISNNDGAAVKQVPAAIAIDMDAHPMRSFDGPFPPKMRGSVCNDFSKMLDAISAGEPFNLKETRR